MEDYYPQTELLKRSPNMALEEKAAVTAVVNEEKKAKIEGDKEVRYELRLIEELARIFSFIVDQSTFNDYGITEDHMLIKDIAHLEPFSRGLNTLDDTLPEMIEHFKRFRKDVKRIENMTAKNRGAKWWHNNKKFFTNEEARIFEYCKRINEALLQMLAAIKALRECGLRKLLKYDEHGNKAYFNEKSAVTAFMEVDFMRKTINDIRNNLIALKKHYRKLKNI